MANGIALGGFARGLTESRRLGLERGRLQEMQTRTRLMEEQNQDTRLFKQIEMTQDTLAQLMQQAGGLRQAQKAAGKQLNPAMLVEAAKIPYQQLTRLRQRMGQPPPPPFEVYVAQLEQQFNSGLTAEEQQALKEQQMRSEGQVKNELALSLGQQEIAQGLKRDPNLPAPQGPKLVTVTQIDKDGNSKIIYKGPMTTESQMSFANNGFHVQGQSGQTINIQGDKRESTFRSELGKLQANDFMSVKETAEDGLNSLRMSQEAMKLLDEGMVTGFGAGAIVEVAKALAQAGIIDPIDSVANTQSYIAARATEVAAIIKAFGAGTGLSDTDRDFAEKAAGAVESLDEKAIRRILEMNDITSRYMINKYNKNLSRMKNPEEMGLFPIEMPEQEKKEEVVDFNQLQ